MTAKIKLHPYQVDGITFVEEQPRGIVVLGVGKGKTEIALRGARRLKCRTLVICTKSLVEQWETVAKNRLPFLLVVPFSQLEQSLHRIQEFDADMCIVDEPKPLKSHTRVWEFFTTHLMKIRRRLILDATPIENRLEEAWFLFRWLKPKVFGSLENFRSLFVTSSGRFKNMNKFRDMIRPHIFRPKTAEPRKREFFHLRVDAKFTDGDSEVYWELCEKLHGHLAAARRKRSLRALNLSRGKISKLRSFLGDCTTGGASKISMLFKFLRKNPKRRGVIFVYKRETAKIIARSLQQHGFQAEVFDGSTSTTKRGDLRKRFNEGAIQFLVATSAGERGIDLPTGNLVVHFDLPWTRAAYDQRDRVSRLSSDQSERSLILTLILKDTVEEVIWSIIAAKRDLMIKPFEPGSDDLVITRKSWFQFLSRFIGVEDDGEVNEETGEGLWFSRGEKSHR